MKKVKQKGKFSITILLSLFCATLLLLAVSCPYQKMKPAPDVDKGLPAPAPPAIDNSCWMATAANMLAGAGYGNGNTVQQRAEDIYADMVANYGKTNRGWPLTALQWWLNSTNNTWTNNPYIVTNRLGHTSMYPWNRSDIPQIIGDTLRHCHFAGICFSWPTDAIDPRGIPVIGSGGHATTAWGDNFGKNDLSMNPTQIRMADSDRDAGGDIQIYNYDSYNSPNPGGPNEGNGCYFDFSNNHPYIRCVPVLSPTDNPSDDRLTQMVVGSYKIHQKSRINAIDLHYKVGTDVVILSYNTSIDWDIDVTPTITESQPQRTELTVDWNLSEKPVPFCKWVTITTEFVLPRWNGIYYEDVYFTFPKPEMEIFIPELNWEINTPFLTGLESLPDVTGGYVIGNFDIINPEDSVVAEYRLVHQYAYNQSPEFHQFFIDGEKGYSIANLKFGHSYGYLIYKELWEFEEWMTELDKKIPLVEKRIEIKLDWEGKLPYPKGIDIRDALKYIMEKEIIFDFELDKEYPLEQVAEITDIALKVLVEAINKGELIVTKRDDMYFVLGRNLYNYLIQSKYKKSNE